MARLKAVLRAGCKVNLYFKILKKRRDGYHDIESLFIPLKRPCDFIYVMDDDEFKVRCNIKELEGETNILYKTYRVYCETVSFYPKISVYLKKGIPHGSGLGGGSADAGAFLNYLNSIVPINITLPSTDLKKLAVRIGADVQFFLENRVSWVEGIGDRIFPMNGVKFPFKFLLLIVPPFKSNTARAYLRWDGFFSLTKKENTFKKRLTQNSQILINSFEKVLFSDPYYKDLRSIKRELLRLGFVGVVLSGSGSSIVGVTTDKKVLLRGCRLVKNKGWRYYIHRF